VEGEGVHNKGALRELVRVRVSADTARPPVSPVSPVSVRRCRHWRPRAVVPGACAGAPRRSQAVRSWYLAVVHGQGTDLPYQNLRSARRPDFQEINLKG
jgi:hypothetical protein